MATSAPQQAGTAADTNAKRTTRNNELFRIQLVLLIVQLAVPIYFYHGRISFDLPASVIAERNGHGHGPPEPGESQSDSNSPISAHPVPSSRAHSNSDTTSTTRGIDPADVVGTFNNVPISYVPPSDSERLHSTAHCVGETFHETSWVHRSCEYRNVCFDTDEKEFVLFRSPTEAALADALDGHDMVQNGLLTTSSALNTSVSLGGINMKWTWKATEALALEWAPIVRDEELTGGYYALPEGTVLLPFHSMAAVNVGHLMWDDFLPMYSLLSMFEMMGDRLLPLRYVLKNRPRALWATCNLRDQTMAECKAFFKKFLPLMGVEPHTMRSTEDSVLNITDGSRAMSRYVCSSKGAAGLGMLTDHGLKTHGWDKPDYDYSHNTGRGPVFNGFRNFMMHNIGLDPMKPVRTEPPYIITVSPASSKDPDRRHTFRAQIDALKQAFGDGNEDKSEVLIRTVDFKRFSVAKQVELAAESAVIVGACGGGAVTNMFLPKGAGMILYYPDKPRGRMHHYPARLDWDYFNNQGYARMHWLPVSSMNSPDDLDLFVKLVRNEIETISHH